VYADLWEATQMRTSASDEIVKRYVTQTTLVGAAEAPTYDALLKHPIMPGARSLTSTTAPAQPSSSKPLSSLTSITDALTLPPKVGTNMTDPRNTMDCTIPIYLDPAIYSPKLGIPLGYWYGCMDAKGQDISQVIPEEMATTPERIRSFQAACDADESCEGFNSDGWLKFGSLRGRFFAKPDIDFYSKIPPICPTSVQVTEVMGYWSLSCFDVTGYDLRRVKMRASSKVVSVADMKKFCDGDTECLGFNSVGWLKSHHSNIAYKFTSETDFYLKPSMETFTTILLRRGG